MSRDLDEWCYENWMKVPEEDRDRCINHLMKKLPTETIGELVKDNIDEDVFFHYGLGMGIRNLLRDVLEDKDLPGIDHPEHGVMHNWDDYYTGAIRELKNRMRVPLR